MTEEKQRADIKRILINALIMCLDFGYDKRLIAESLAELIIDGVPDAR